MLQDYNGHAENEDQVPWVLLTVYQVYITHHEFLVHCFKKTWIIIDPLFMLDIVMMADMLGILMDIKAITCIAIGDGAVIVMGISI